MKDNNDLLDQEAKLKKIKHEFSLGLNKIELSGVFAWYFIIKLIIWFLYVVATLYEDINFMFNL